VDTPCHTGLCLTLVQALVDVRVAVFLGVVCLLPSIGTLAALHMVAVAAQQTFTGEGARFSKRKILVLVASLT
jgi:hypothetical protein